MAKDVLLGAVIGAHGLKGEVRVKTFTGTPEALGAYGPLHTKDGRVLEIAHLRAGKGGEAIVAFRALAGRDDADALKGEELFVARTALPQAEAEEFYHADLIGLRAEDELGRAIGDVRAIHNFGAGDVIEIAREGDSVLLPFTRETVPVIDVTAGRIVVAVPEEDEEAAHKGNVE